MIVLLFIIIIIVIAAALGGTVWFAARVRRSRPGGVTGETVAAGRLPFRWRYVMVPVVVLLVSILIFACYYRQLPATGVATHFLLDGSPDGWLSRELTMVWLLAPQLLLAFLAGAITWGVGKLEVLSRQARGALIEPEKILLFMGNIVALPQLVVLFAMLDIFSYNSYRAHIMPVWVFLIVILGLATIILGVLLTLTILRLRRPLVPHQDKETRSVSGD